MSKVTAVIGAGYGDEGKGLMTDYFSDLEETIVVRSNGGAQAGHTVCTPEGQRHIFSHIGSGTYCGSPTYLSEYFVANPALLKKEMDTYSKPLRLQLYAHPNMIITSPFDVLINQRFETDRSFEHGSVGVGFGETIERALVSTKLTYGELVNRTLNRGKITDAQLDNALFNYMNAIRLNYVPTRVDLNQVSDTFKEILYNDDLIYDAIADIRLMMDHVKLAGYDMLAQRNVVFEGAQGLLLDQDYGHFPNVTRSNCGMRNISAILKQVPGTHDITANYVTRAYTTRHGAGPLDREDALLTKRHDIVDATNIENEWQGELRFAPLNVDLFDSITDKDFLNYAPRSAKKITTVTCLDQLRGEATIIENGTKRIYCSANMRNSYAPDKFDLCSYGPTRNDVVDFSHQNG